MKDVNERSDPGRGGYDENNRGEGVLLIYTGGTIGSMPRDPDDPDSPRSAVDWRSFRSRTPALNRLLPNGDPNPAYIGFNVDAYWTEPLDSCDIRPAQWLEIARVIEESHDRYEGFVLLHGTDTMAYTASALSFMLENLGRPVVLTGAQRSHLFNARNDALQNMLTALMIANPGYSGLPVIPEVCIFFNRKLLRGNRARKVNATGYDAYESPNYPPLAVAGERISIDPLLLRPEPGDRKLRVRSTLEPNVVPLSFFPGIQDGVVLDSVLGDPNLRGVVLMTYGAGNVPTSERVLNAIRTATERGVVMTAVTQCGGGRVELGMYETSARLMDFGVVSGVDITPEAALTKLMVLLGDPDLTPSEAARLAQQDLAGEQSLSIHVTDYSGPGPTTLTSRAPPARLAGRRVEGYDARPDAIEQVVLRFYDARVLTGDGAPLVIRLYADLGLSEPADAHSGKLVGTFRRRPTQANRSSQAHPTTYFVFSGRARRMLRQRTSFSVCIDKPGDPDARFSWTSVELAVFRRAEY
jgi:L-asparaginase